MKLFVKPVLVPVLIIAAFLALIFGAYLPYAKANAYITALSNLRNVQTLNELETDFNQSLQAYSPIGQRETVKFTISTLQSIANQKGQGEDVVKGLIDYIEPYVKPGDDYIFPVLSMGDFYFTLWANYTRADSDYAKALAYYKDAYALGPDLPPVLYPLLQLYVDRGDSADALEIAHQIHEYWPTDAQITAYINSFASTTGQVAK